jgi:hypothetical protein
MEMMLKQNIDIKNTSIVMFTSPFQRCVDTSIGIVKGIQNVTKTPPILRLDIGLGEWMCERFFDSICPAQHLLSKQQEKLARQQAYSYSMLAAAAKKESAVDDDPLLLPPLTIDYAYSNSLFSEFDFPERYTDMIHRFEDTRLNCLESALSIGSSEKTSTSSVDNNEQQKQKQVVVIFVTHAVGVNALLDGFRNRVTIPLESNYCSISCVRHASSSTSTMSNNMAAADLSDQSDEDCEYMEENNNSGFNSPSKLSKWFIDTVMYDRHLSS